MSKAPAGAIYVSHEAQVATGDRYVWTDVGTFPVEGKSEPVAVWSLDRPAVHQRTREIRYPLPMVGREAELERVDHALTELGSWGS